MHRIYFFSLLSIFFLMTFNTTAAHARLCSGQLAAEYSGYSDSELEAIQLHLRDTSTSWCESKWTGVLAQTGVPAQIVMEAALGDNSLLMREVQNGLVVADQALIKLGSDGKIGNRIKVILASRNVEETGGPGPDAYTLFKDGICTLVIVPRSHSLLGETGAMAFIMAHELFHCVQNASIDNYARTHNLWWGEGSAHWFAHMAQPNHVVETYNQSANRFERGTLDKPIGAFSYSTWPFFAWVAQHRGNAGAVMLLLKAMPEGRHSDADIAGLLSPEDWDEFAKQYSAYQIMVTERVRVDPRPRANLPVTPIELPNINDEQEYPFLRRTAGLNRDEINLKAGDWELTTDSPGKMFLSEIKASGDPDTDWDEISAATPKLEISVPCGEDRSYALVGFGSSPASDNFALKARKAGDPCELICAEPPSSHDACLIGIWRETDLAIPDIAENMIQKQIAAAGAKLTSLDVPDPIVTFFPDSNAVTIDVTGSGIVKARGQSSKMELTLGRGDAIWGTAGNEETGYKLLICPKTMSMRGEMTVNAPGRSLSIPFSRNMRLDAPPYGSPDGILFDYTCDENSVTLFNAEKDITGRLER